MDIQSIGPAKTFGRTDLSHVKATRQAQTLAAQTNTAKLGGIEKIEGAFQTSTEARKPRAASVDLRAGAIRTFIHEMDLLQARTLTRGRTETLPEPIDTLV